MAWIAREVRFTMRENDSVELVHFCDLARTVYNATVCEQRKTGQTPKSDLVVGGTQRNRVERFAAKSGWMRARDRYRTERGRGEVPFWNKRSGGSCGLPPDLLTPVDDQGRSRLRVGNHDWRLPPFRGEIPNKKPCRCQVSWYADGFGDHIWHLVAYWQVEVPGSNFNRNVVGVDVGLRSLITAATSDPDAAAVVQATPSHRRDHQIERLETKATLSEKDHLALVRYRRARVLQDRQLVLGAVRKIARHQTVAVEEIDWPNADLVGADVMKRTQEAVVETVTEAGGQVVFVSPLYSSRTCRWCNYVNPATADETWTCRSCGRLQNRDHTAAAVLAQRAERVLANLARSG